MFNFGEVLKTFEKQFARISKEKPTVWSYGDKTVYTTWTISLDAIRSKEPKLAEFFMLFSFFSNEDISEEILRRGLGLEEDCKELVVRAFDSILTKRRATDHDMDDYLKPLLSYSLVKRKGVLDSVYIHLLVHYWAREHLPLKQRRDKPKKALLFINYALACNARKPEQWSFERRIIPHIFALLEHHQKYTTSYIEGSGDVSSVATSLGSISTSLLYQGHWNDAEGLELQVMEMRKRVLGQEHPDTLTCMNNLASIYRKQGRWKEAEGLQLQVVETRKRVLCQEHPATLTSMRNLAAIFRKQGRLKEAEELLAQSKCLFLNILKHYLMHATLGFSNSPVGPGVTAC